MLGSIRWLYVPGEPQTEFKGDDNGHGICVISKVASPTFGVAKSANVVVVRVGLVDHKVQISSAIAAWGVVAIDIDSQGMQRNAVVSASMSG